MSAIVAALQSVPQLILTRESKLTKSEKQLLRQLEGILSPLGDHRRHPVVRCALPLFVIVLPIYPGPQSWQCIASPTLYYIPFSSTDY